MTAEVSAALLARAADCLASLGTAYATALAADLAAVAEEAGVSTAATQTLLSASARTAGSFA